MTQQFPLLPLRDIVVFPGMVVPLFVGRDKSVAALEAAMEASKDSRMEREVNSSDSEQKDSDESEQEMEPKKTQRGQRVGVNDLFTPDTVAQIATPVTNRKGKDGEEAVFQARLDSAAGIEMIAQDEEVQVSGRQGSTGDAVGALGKDERDDSARPLVQSE